MQVVVLPVNVAERIPHLVVDFSGVFRPVGCACVGRGAEREFLAVRVLFFFRPFCAFIKNFFA